MKNSIIMQRSHLCIKHNEIFRNENFWNEIDDEEPRTMLCLYRYVNEIRELHDLPLLDLSEWEMKLEEQIEQNREKTAEEERLEKLNADLDEYLRIGEESSKQ